MSKTNHVMAKHFRGKIKSFEKMNTDFMTEYIDTLQSVEQQNGTSRNSNF